ncbi:hypothetical protein M441DRAFT_50658 [Trichoderma asperellum CBS 433.97]|uniref:Uncharacterized protein n=1 Tax=Trichoderma asperellum (strain ATCC 204424 / CBS 433.97 / NBRC 101777) TaxID=1042311 RepID=A0A2T3YXZ2_TRIA4|nr:hypothetical protein M441DRAFT_50658 [Trichoderma asperellum CBS 433.97]PTB37400.1 hypothetical protein M441DRAFT_50658 [Trichoderma asperellum CBS 433.97]
MSTTFTKWTDANGGYSGKVRDNWDAVYGQALAGAKQNIFNALLEESDATEVHVDTLGKQFFKHHGFKYEWNGHLTNTFTGEHAHTDHDKLGRFKNWQGSRNYRFGFDIEKTAMD